LSRREMSSGAMLCSRVATRTTQLMQLSSSTNFISFVYWRVDLLLSGIMWRITQWKR